MVKKAEQNERKMRHRIDGSTPSEQDVAQESSRKTTITSSFTTSIPTTTETIIATDSPKESKESKESSSSPLILAPSASLDSAISPTISSLNGVLFLNNNNITVIDKTGTLEGHFRKLMGSTCLIIERGVVSKYYECIGCPIEAAQACIDDMRHNKSGNIAQGCHIGALTMAYESTSCCPTYLKEMKKKRGKYERSGELNMIYPGSQYPETLRCLETVGCTESVVYKQLVEECHAVCPFSDPRGKVNKIINSEGKEELSSDVCFARVNSSSRWSLQSVGSLIAISIGVFMSTVFF